MANRTQEAVLTPAEIAEWQAQMNLTDSKIAHELGFSKGHWSRLKNGRTPLNMKTFNAMIGMEARKAGFDSLLGKAGFESSTESEAND